MSERILRLLLKIPRRIYDMFLDLKTQFLQNNMQQKIKMGLILIFSLILFIPLAVFGFFVFLFLLGLILILRLFFGAPQGQNDLFDPDSSHKN